MDFLFGEVDNLESVPDTFRVLYSDAPDSSGKYQVKPDMSPVANSLLGLNKSLQASRKEAKARTPVDLSALSEYGATPDEIAQAFKAKRDELETSLAQGDKAKLNVDKIRDELSKAHAMETAKLKERETGLLGEIRNLRVTQVAMAAIVDQKGDPELLMPFVNQQIQVVEENGKFVTYVVDAQGDRRYSGVTGQPMTVEELVKEMKSNAKYGRLFESDHQSGGGGTDTRGTRTPPPRGNQTRSSVDKISAGLKSRR